MSEKLLIDAEIAPAHVADEAVGFESAFMDGINGMMRVILRWLHRLLLLIEYVLLIY